MNDSKYCPGCKETKPHHQFHKNRAKLDGMGCYCKTCANKQRKYQSERPESVAKRQTPEWIARNREAQNRHSAKHREKVNQRSRESQKRPQYKALKSQRRRRQYRSDTEFRLNAIAAAHLYRSRRRKNRTGEGDFCAQDVKDMHARQKARCYYCNVSIADEFHVDHVIPLSRGGSNGTDNIVLACAACNHKKGAKTPAEWGGSDKLL